MLDAKKVKKQIVEWIVDYFQNNGSPETKAVIGISGGKDSSIVAGLCVEALGKKRVLGILIPQGEQQDVDVSYDLCKTKILDGYIRVGICEDENLKAKIDRMHKLNLRKLNPMPAFKSTS